MDATAATDLVAEAAERNIKVLGLEGFLIDDTGIYPALSRIADSSIEFGRRFNAMQIEWIDWATEQVAAGTLEPGGALPAVAES